MNDEVTQEGMLIMERENARATIERGFAVRYCPGPGWPVHVVGDMREFERLQALSRRGVGHVRRRGN